MTSFLHLVQLKEFTTNAIFEATKTGDGRSQITILPIWDRGELSIA
jgi:hypothetical protein